MFFCNSCGETRNWPESTAKSGGNCEICGQHAACNDVPSGVLSNWESIDTFLGNPETGVQVSRPLRPRMEIF